MTKLLIASRLGLDSPEAAREAPILHDIELELDEGEFVAVMGPSGSGKSSLLHCLSGLERPSRGTVVLCDQELGKLSERKRTLLRRKRTGFVFQFFNLLPDLTVEENVLLPFLIVGEDPAPHRARLDEVFAALDLDDLRDRRPHALSGGELQRASIARALAVRPELLFADEPTGNLASAAGERTMQLLRALNERFQTAILLVTHNPRDAAFADRVLFLKDGGLVQGAELKGEGIDASLVFSRLEELGI
ncbi:MAG: ABC transporter ATP-binding protein [Planctomycetes bacterium]|nr:ABC transporter ATP-binding protein [Planctomycetota bacterium]